jgi:hypothetical protein
MPRAQTVVHRAITIDRGNQATMPRMRIHHNIAPQKVNPKRNPSHPASRAVARCRIAYMSGAGATKMSHPISRGGKAIHMRTAEASTVAT